VISRYLVIALALIAAGFKASQGALVETVGLASLALGLVILKLAGTRPGLKPMAWLSFLVTAIAMGTVLMRR